MLYLISEKYISVRVKPKRRSG